MRLWSRISLLPTLTRSRVPGLSPLVLIDSRNVPDSFECAPDYAAISSAEDAIPSRARVTERKMTRREEDGKAGVWLLLRKRLRLESKGNESAKADTSCAAGSRSLDARADGGRGVSEIEDEGRDE